MPVETFEYEPMFRCWIERDRFVVFCYSPENFRAAGFAVGHAVKLLTLSALLVVRLHISRIRRNVRHRTRPPDDRISLLP